MSPEIHTPKDLLYPLQRKFVDDLSQFKIGATTRQWGKSLTTSGESVHDAITDPGTKWVCMSAGERQSIEWLSKAKEWLAAYKMVIEDVAEDRGGMAEGLLRSSEIHLANGSKIIAIPANPSTARGYSANIILDEFAYHEDPNAIWAALFPSTTNKLAGTFLDRWRAMLDGESTDIRRDLKLRIVSTFNGRNNKFFDLWDRAKENGYSAHKVTIHDAVADGMPLDVEKLRKALDDDDIWAQEFECEPMDTASVLLTYELIAGCESNEATTTIPSDFWAPEARSEDRLYMGIDFARSRHLSVAWTASKSGEILTTREVHEMAKMSTPDQFRQLAPRIEKVNRVAFDCTGPGIGLGDDLVEAFGEWNPSQDKFGKIELYHFSQGSKVPLFSRLKSEMERRNVLIPVNRTIREDLHSVHRMTTASGNIVYRAPQTADGHADRCTALALMLHAASGPTAQFAYEPSERNDGLLHRAGRRIRGLF